MPSTYLSGRAKRPKSPSGTIEKSICDTLKAEGFLSNREIADITGIDKSSVIRNTKRLTDMGVLRVCGKGVSGVCDTEFHYYELVKAREIVKPVMQKPVNASNEGVPKVIRKSVAANEVPYLKWWEGGGLYANLDDQETRLVA